MKKIYFLLVALVIGVAANAQTLPNAGLESWRTGTSGSLYAETIQAPIYWFGTDSLIIADGQTYKMDSMTPQLFQETSFVNTGSSAAKVMTLFQDSTLGIFPGSLTNSQIHVNVLALLTGGSFKDAVTFTGGTPVTLKITTVSAYVAYFPGKDTTTHLTGLDTAIMTVEAHGLIHGVDSLLGTGFAQIAPGATYTQVTATIAYTDTVDSVGVVRIFFNSSGGGSTLALDSSTLYVDDVSMTGVAEPIQPDHTGVKNVAANDAVKVYPNPSTGTLYINGLQNQTATCTLFSVSGQVAATQVFTGNTSFDVSHLPSGMYFYAITDEQGAAIQRGKVAVEK